MTNLKNKGIGTISIHGGSKKNAFGALTTPIFQSSTFIFDSAEQGGRRFALEEDGYIYGRLGNPTVSVVEEKLALLENAEAGLGTASGMGAISATFWTFLKSGDHIVTDKTLYGCAFAFLNAGISRFGVEVSFIDTSDLQAVKDAIKPNTKIIYLETPTNPNLKIVDIEAIGKIAKNYENIKLIVDNTFASPYCQKPLDLGADIVVHSATKYINGHGDLLAGFVLGKKEDLDQIRFIGIKDMTGAVLAPAEASLIIRGLKTFQVRMERHCESALKVARFLEGHPKIKKVYYPGLESHKGYEIAKKQMINFGGTLAFELKDGFEAGKKLLNTVELCTLAVSLGCTETLIEHPASMTHSPYTKEELKAAGLDEGLVRLSVGLEDIEDIIEDLDTALNNL